MFKIHEDNLKIKLFFSALSLALISGFYNIYMLKQRIIYFHETNETFFDFIANTFGYLDMQEIKYIFPVLIWLFPILLLMYFLSNYIGTDIREKGSIIFTRTASRGKWFSKKCVSLILYIFLFYGIYLLTLVLIWSFFGIGFNRGNLLSVVSLVVLNILFGVMTLIIMNVLSLFIEPTYSMLSGLLIYIVNAFYVSWIVEHMEKNIGIIKYTPIAQGIYLWHSDASLPSGIEFQNFIKLHDFKFTVSLITIVIIGFVAYIVGFCRIKKMDII